MKHDPLVDFHCDVLSKLLGDESLSFDNDPTGKLDVTYERLAQAGGCIQAFAIYIPEHMERGLRPVLRSVDLFYRSILSHPGIKLICSARDINEAQQAGRIGALLTLEGVDGLQEDFSALRVLFHLGVRSIGLTWNHANWAADGVLEPRQGGLTGKGRRLVKLCNELGILLDVSHLTDKGFWELADLSSKPFIASHSNSRAICDHPRNLTDDQIRAIIAVDGRIGITFVPWFVRKSGEATVTDVIRHIENVCELGGASHLMLGSDYDGIDSHIAGLSHPGETPRLAEAMQPYYTDEQIAGFFGKNAIQFLESHLPSNSSHSI
ncbi:dipeptidase [Paenibacillus sp. GCM10012307]|uniref:Dipeptidase n=1 Tax=Paenibacillus roseus TaxID=2798579 RepID=A0A934JC54_9BACL|nr:dipeptidase [Paenibacillus roseus]MBJ6364115.1 dipeptidase [Paenibacillus roseus]